MLTNEEVVREMLANLDPYVQLSIANEIATKLNFFNPNITQDDAVNRITEDYAHVGHDPDKLALEFFESSEWRTAVEASEATFWDDGGIEILNSPLHVWLKERGIHHTNDQPESTETDASLNQEECPHENITWVFDPKTPGAWSPLNSYDAVCNDCKVELTVKDREDY